MANLTLTDCLYKLTQPANPHLMTTTTKMKMMTIPDSVSGSAVSSPASDSAVSSSAPSLSLTEDTTLTVTISKWFLWLHLICTSWHVGSALHWWHHWCWHPSSPDLPLLLWSLNWFSWSKAYSAASDALSRCEWSQHHLSAESSGTACSDRPDKLSCSVLTSLY